ncbi:MAG: hypothetical protein ACTSYG_08495 [Candidatus Heimdallarchaeota archaeon]
MKYVRIKNSEITGMEVSVPVVFRIDGKEYTGLLNGKIDTSTTEQLEDGEAVEER